MKNTAHDILLLVERLSQLKDQKQIIQEFTDTINTLHQEIKIEYCDKLEARKKKHFLPIQTDDSSFGYFRLTGDPDKISPDFSRILRSGVHMLAVILKKNDQENQLVSYQNELEESVNQRIKDLLVSEAKYKQLINLAQEGIWVIDQNEITTFVNSAMARMLGYEVREMVGKHVFHFMDENGIKIAEEKIQQLRSGSNEKLNFEFIRKDGSRLQATVECAPIFDDEANYMGAVASIIDITEKKKAEEARRLLEQRFQTFFNYQPNYSLIVALNGKILDVNRLVCLSLEMTKEELIGKPIFSIYTPESQSKAKQLFEIWKSTGAIHEEELTIQTKSGKKKHVILNGTAVKDADGRIIHAILVHQDVTEQTYIYKSILKLTELADILTDFPEDRDIFRFLGQNILDFIRKGIVAVGRLDNEMSTLFLNELFGLSPSERKFMEKKLAIKLDKLKFNDIPQKLLDKYSEGKIIRLERGLYDFFLKQIPEDKCREIERALNISAVYIIGIEKKERIFGSVTIFAQPETLLFSDVIETFVNQTANTISRLESEKNLRLSQQRLELALESTGIALWDQNFVTGQVYRSKQWAEMLGYSLEEIDSSIEPWYDLIHPDDLKEVEKITKLHESGKIPFIKIEHRMRAKNGEWRWIQNWGKIVDRDKKGKPLRAVGTNIDITERKVMELALLENKILLETIFENAPVGILFMKVDGSGFRANKIFYEIAGTEPGSKFPQIPDSNVHPEDREIVEKDFYDFLKGKTKFHRQFRILRPDGEVRHVLGQIYPQITPDGETIGYISTITDITEQLQAQIALQEREATLSSIFRSAPIGIGLVIDKIFQQVNEYFCQMLGYTREELLGKSTRKVYPSEEIFKQVESFKYEQIQKAGRGAIETQMQTKNGKVVEILLSFSPVDPQHWEKGITFTALDITESKQAERALRQSEQHYRSLVDTIPDIVLIFDTNSKILFASPSLEKQTGYSIEELEKAIPDPKIIHVEDLSRTKKLFQDFMKSGRDISHPIEFKIYSKAGIIRWYSALIARTEFKGKLAFLLVARDITVNKEIEMKLRESERRFSTFMDELPAAVCIKDKNSVTLYVNKYKDDIFDASKWLGKDCYEIFPESLSKKMRANDVKTLQQGLVHAIETIPDKEGAPRIFETRRFLLKRENEDPLIGEIALDITDRVRAEEALVDSERKYRALFNSLNEGVALHEIVYDDEGKAIDYRILDINPAFEKLTGFYKEKTIGKLASELYQMTPPPFLAVYSHVAETRRPIIFENFFETLKRHFLVAVFSPQKGQFASAFLDITEAKLAEKALKESEERFRLIVQNIPVMVDAFDENGHFVFWNKECERVTGYSASEIVNNPEAMKLLYPDKTYLESLLKEWEKRENKFDSWEIELTKKNGEKRVISWYNISADVPIPGWKSWAIGIDITEQKHAEAQVKKYTENLERMVAERTSELEEKTRKLEQSQKALTFLLEDVNESRRALENLNKQLQEANRDLESFAYSVSHDLRSPLRHIDGFSRILQEKFRDSLNKEARHLLDNISDAAQQMGELIESLLQFSRMGRVDLKMRKLNMDSLIENVIENLQFEIGERKINWKIEKMPEAWGDETLIRQVWHNLISNAIKFTRPRRVAKIEISAKEEGDHFIFSVQDNGVGFDMKFANKLFGVFQRLHSKRDFEGIGIGLANVKRIVQRHGGKIWAKGKVGKGAIFYFSLPKSEEGINL